MSHRISYKSSSILIALLLALGAGVTLFSSRTLFAAAGNPIIGENQNPGSTAWRIDYSIAGLADDTNQQIKGYASAVSVNKGQSINFYVTVNPAQTYKIDIYRMGWYNGAGGRLLQTVGPLTGAQQPACPMDTQTGMTECNWAVAYTLNVPTTWTTGIYLAKLTNAASYQSYITFTVRDDSRIADFLYQQPVTTYQAYNNYPADGTHGKSLYDFNSRGALTGLGTQRAVKVSFNRPYGGNGGGDGGGHFADDIFWERYFVSWVERMGYDISYTTDIDTHANGARLLNYKGVLSVGHDEYWTKQMFDAFAAARDAGVNLAFFGANAAYWQVRLEPSSLGGQNRILVGYKNSALDPVADPTLKTILWRDTGRAEQTLLGLQFTVGADSTEATAPYIIQNSSNWVWSNTGFTDNTAVPGLTGYEVDKLFANYPTPVSQSYTKLASSPYLADVGESSLYQAPSGAWVFDAGTMSWSWGLDRTSFVNAGIQQATKNILDRFLQGAPTPTPTNTPPATPTNTPPATPTNTPPATPTNTPTATPAPACTGRITSFRLWNLGNNTAVAAYNPIINGSTIYLQDLPANYTIDALTSGTIGSIKFTINGAQTAIENFAPWRAFGDANPWKPTPGAYTVSATVYQNSNATGGICDTKSVSFTVANRQGANYEYYEGFWNFLPNFSFLRPLNTGVVNNFNLTPAHRADNFAFRYTACINVPSLGTYTFFTKSDDGSKLYIDNLQIVNNDGLHSALERAGSVRMGAGHHNIVVTFFEATGAEVLEVRYQGPGIAKQLIPDSVLTPGSCAAAAAAEPVATPEGDNTTPGEADLNQHIFLPLISSTTNP
ncbi:MAG: DUF6605 domain-containing protein [Caldilineaceae bacterium]